MKIYIAAPWRRKPEAVAAGEKFAQAGFEVTSRWFDHHGDPNDSSGLTESDKAIRIQACEDLLDVSRSDYVVVLNLEKSEGKAVETGYAIALGIPFVYVGPRPNIFQTLGTGPFYSVEDAIQYLQTQ